MHNIYACGQALADLMGVHHRLRQPPLLPQVGSPLTALAISSGITEKGNVPRLVAAADTSGTLHLYDRAGGLSLSLPPEDGAPATTSTRASPQTSAASPRTVVAITIGTREDPFIATATLGGEVNHVHADSLSPSLLGP